MLCHPSSPKNMESPFLSNAFALHRLRGLDREATPAAIARNNAYRMVDRDYQHDARRLHDGQRVMDVRYAIPQTKEHSSDY